VGAVEEIDLGAFDVDLDEAGGGGVWTGLLTGMWSGIDLDLIEE